MKKSISFIFGIAVIIILLCVGISGCNESDSKKGLWSQAIYTENTEFGKGQNTVIVEVVAEDKSVTFTIHSDKKTLGDALVEHSLIEGEKGPYGLYVKKVNGIIADYDENKCYWGISKNGESVMMGVDSVEFKDGEHYEFVYTK